MKRSKEIKIKILKLKISLKNYFKKFKLLYKFKYNYIIISIVNVLRLINIFKFKNYVEIEFFSIIFKIINKRLFEN